MARRYYLGGLPVHDGDWLKPSEAAEIAGTGITTLRRRERDGTIPPGAVTRTPSGHRRYLAGAIIALREGAGRPRPPGHRRPGPGAGE